MNNEFIVKTGSVIKEYLEEAGMNQKECALRLGLSEKHFSNILNGKSRLTEDVAIKLENIFRDIPASYWLNYESKYREYIKREELLSQKYQDQQLKELAKRFKFNKVFSGLDWNLYKQADEMLKLLRISSFEQFDKVYSTLDVNFMEDGGEIESIAIWLNLAHEEVEIQNRDLSSREYKKEKLVENLYNFKLLALNNDYRQSLISATKLLNKLGVYLVFLDAIENSKIRGALTSYKNLPAIYLTGRFKTHDHVWFALMHEIGHLIYHYTPNNPLITFEKDLSKELNKSNIEEEANEFARNFFINKEEYINFVRKNIFTPNSIYTFAKSQKVLPGIVVARLQHDGYIEYSELNNLKNR